MNKKIQNKIFLVIILFLLSSFQFASAALVPCGPGLDDPVCDTCDFFVLIDNIIKFVSLELAPVLAVLMFLVGGFIWVMSGGSETNIKKGRTIMTSAVVGFLIILTSWLFIHTIMKYIANKSIQKNWYNIECSD